MRFDFHNDRRLMKEGDASVGSASQAVAPQLERLMTDLRTARGQAAQEAARQRLYQFIIQNKLIDANNDAMTKIIEMAREVEQKRAQQTQEVAGKGAEANIGLQTRRGESLYQVESSAATSKFEAEMIGPRMQATWCGLLKAGAKIIDSVFGCDTSGFQDRMQKAIDEIKFPTIDRSGIQSVDTNISTADGQRMVGEAAQSASETLAGASKDQILDVAGTLLRGIQGGAPAAAPAADRITYAQFMQKTQGVAGSIFQAAAGVGGDKQSLDSDAEKNLFRQGLQRSDLNANQRTAVLQAAGLDLASGPR